MGYRGQGRPCAPGGSSPEPDWTPFDAGRKLHHLKTASGWPDALFQPSSPGATAAQGRLSLDLLQIRRSQLEAEMGSCRCSSGRSDSRITADYRVTGGIGLKDRQHRYQLPGADLNKAGFSYRSSDLGPTATSSCAPIWAPFKFIIPASPQRHAEISTGSSLHAGSDRRQAQATPQPAPLMLKGVWRCAPGGRRSGLRRD